MFDNETQLCPLIKSEYSERVNVSFLSTSILRRLKKTF